MKHAKKGRKYHMMGTAILWAELRRGLKNHLAYPIQAACEIITVIFIAVAVPALREGSFLRGISGAALEHPEKTVALVMVFVALIGLQIVHRVVGEESDLGTLEQLCLTPVGLPALIMFRCAADTIRMLPVVLMVVGFFSPSGQVVQILAIVCVIILLMNIGMLGIGFILGSLTLVAKRTGFIPNLVSLTLLPLAMSSSNELPAIIESAGSVVPFTQGIRLMERALKSFPVSSWVSDLMRLCILSALWLVIGIKCFVRAERFARERGLLGKY